jgi:hypothetical protein
MAAGLGFKDFVTGEVLTAADVDGYLMQGIWVFASAAARDSAVTSPQEGNFAYLKDTNTTTYYTGSAWTNLDTTGMVNPMTTTGDTIYSSSGSTPARLGIGSSGQVLTVAGGVPTWATPSSAASYRGVSLYGTAVQSIPNATDTILTFNSEAWDTDGYHSTSTNTSRITIPAGLGGKYLVTMNTSPALNGTGGRYMEIYKNGARLVNDIGIAGSASLYVNLAGTFVVNLVATDYIEMLVYQDSGGALNFNKAATTSPFTATYLGA